MIAFLQRLGSAFEPRAQLCRIEELDWFIAQGFVETVAKVTRIGEPVPRLFRHPLMDDATDGLIHFGIEFRYRRRNLMPDGIDDLFFIGATERMSSGQSFVTYDAQRKQI